MTQSTKQSLLDAAQELFARQGFQATSIREIAAEAGANLAAVTYHFGSKRELYEAVVERVTSPIRDRLQRGLSEEGSALDRIEASVRATFAFLQESPDVPRLVMQQLVTEEPLPAAAAETMKRYIGRVAELITAGQRDGTIRDGDSRLLALSFAGTPMFLAIYRRALKEAVGLDQDSATIRRDLVDTTVRLIRTGLAAEGT